MCNTENHSVAAEIKTERMDEYPEFPNISDLQRTGPGAHGAKNCFWMSNLYPAKKPLHKKIYVDYRAYETYSSSYEKMRRLPPSVQNLERAPWTREILPEAIWSLWPETWPVIESSKTGKNALQMPVMQKKISNQRTSFKSSNQPMRCSIRYKCVGGKNLTYIFL